MIEIRVGVPDDRAKLAATMAEAFDEDPVWSWLVPPRRRRERLARIFDALLRFALPRGHVYTTTDLRAVALWSPPRQWKLPPASMARAAVPMVRAAGVRLPRLLGRLGEIERIHEEMSPDHWYLEFIAAADDARGQGLGSALLADALARFDRDGLPVYLESSSERNLSFYARHGFTVTERRRMSSGPPQWLLWRDPR